MSVKNNKSSIKLTPYIGKFLSKFKKNPSTSLTGLTLVGVFKFNLCIKHLLVSTALGIADVLVKSVEKIYKKPLLLSAICPIILTAPLESRLVRISLAPGICSNSPTVEPSDLLICKFTASLYSPLGRILASKS